MAGKQYKGPVHEAVREMTGDLLSKSTRTPKSKSAKARSEAVRKRAQEARKRTSSASGRKRARTQEATTKLLRKGAKSYDEARSMAEYGLGQRTTPAIPSIDNAMRQIASDSMKKKSKSGKKKGRK